MTRLKTEWITYMLEGMDEYNRNLERKTGYNLTGLMGKTFELDDATIAEARKHYKVAVVPITQGEGIIGSFSESVAAIVRSMGFTADVMEHTDVDGIYDGVREGYNLFFFADDIRYLALNTEKNICSDNNYATALGFIQVLKAMMEKKGTSITSKILQIGHGIVGREAVQILKEMGVDFDIYDKKKVLWKVLAVGNFPAEKKLQITNIF